MTTLNPVINEQGSSEPAQQLIQYFSWQEKLRDHDRLAIQVENTPAATKALLGFRELESPALDVGLRKQISTQGLLAQLQNFTESGLRCVCRHETVCKYCRLTLAKEYRFSGPEFMRWSYRAEQFPQVVSQEISPRQLDRLHAETAVTHLDQLLS